MNLTNNTFFSKEFLKSLFFIQNKWHQHGVLIHTLRVTYNILKAGDFKFFAAGLLHDIGKPFCAYKKDAEDMEFGEYSFSDHEEKSYQIIKNWFFISDYTKQIVRYHYLIRDLIKSKEEDLPRYESKKKIWDTLNSDIKKDLEKFLLYDDLGKGKKRR
ncbi:MAG: phosphohydrolase [Sulfurimonas sp. RIFOXYD12_FULL_33_39]|uniref:HD domain-containing protein n=1 Tax=unclassified Sulfurimonas TaxID=2623549 RepID=UPI0008AC353D|nr:MULTISPECIES: HD domain-containing protein [unclassified Sulfurimonas]OHE05512.1 MAG: phosphohydrolase [Sulfurimonas sp. RIFCSPLOWO2_12_FULL_34_6]OHE09259.1 MAG: phosphohydrolase [Sulfurimonas sp. RIFOXYD12_FULL_33_39]OHE12958.1 MAG: phosphohydrolase [Sulfurimonas sp. RIFOXYD2_FULL_34_21]DAB27833.1 MAG TPA: phosphohydrolase [Sulfurimonas sp. UBA10385]